jgi:arginyl-tRNA synthetase
LGHSILIEHSLNEKIDLSIDAPISDLNMLYKKEKFDRDEIFARQARERVVLLQSGNAQSLKIWHFKQSEIYFQAVYQRLDVLLEPQDNRGESFYNPLLPAMINELLATGIAQQDHRAVIIPLLIKMTNLYRC